MQRSPSYFVALTLLIAAFAAPPRVAVYAQEALQPGEALATRFSGTASEGGRAVINPRGTVLSIVDLRPPGGPPQGEHWWDEVQRAPVSAGQIGQVFGIALDDANPPNVYLTATSAFGLHRTADNTNWMAGMWGPGGGPGTVYALDAANELRPRALANITLDGRANTGAALGNIAYDRWNKQLYVSDLETGMIHRLRPSDGTDLGHYDHGTAGRTGFFDVASGRLIPLPSVAFNPASAARVTDCPAGDFSKTPACWNFADFRRRVWGLGVRQDPVSHEVRLFYAVWGSEGFGHPDFAAAGDDQRNSIWSVRIGENGDFDLTGVRREFFLPDFFRSPEAIARSGRSHPVSDIAFPAFGSRAVMLLAERGGVRNLGLDAENAFARPHESRVLRYELTPQGSWRLAGRYDVGYYDRKDEGPPYFRAGSSGGVSFGMGYGESWGIDTSRPDAFVWMTGDGLCSPKSLCFDRSSNSHNNASQVHGLQGRAERPYEAAEPITAFEAYPQPGPVTPATGPDHSFFIDTDINVDAGGGGIEAELHRNDATKIGDVEVYQSAPAEAVPAAAPPGEVPSAEAPPVEVPPGPPPPPEGWEPAPLPPDGWPLPPPPLLNTDLRIQKAGPAQCQWGVNCVYTVTITNLGAGPYSGPLAVNDTMPAGATLASASPGWHCDVAGTAVRCHTLGHAALNVGATATLTLAIQLPAAGAGAQVQNCVDIDWAEMGTDDGPGDANDQVCVPTLVTQGFDLGIEKGGPEQCAEGAACAFTIEVTNHGPGEYNGALAVRDELPANASLVSNSAGFSCVQTGGQVECVSIPLTMPAGATASFTLQVMLPGGIAGQTIENCARIDWDAMGANDGAADFHPDQACHPVSVIDGAGFFDLEISKAGPVHCNAGGNCEYTITVTNHGPDDFTHFIAVRDTPPAGFSYIGATGGVCGVVHPNIFCTLGGPVPVPPGESRTMSLEIRLPDPVPTEAVVNCVVLRWGEAGMPADDNPPPGANEGDDTICAVTFVGAAGFDIGIAKVGPEVCYEGGVCEYSVRLTNHGPQEFGGILAFNDTLPAGATLESTSDAWTCQAAAPGTVACNLFEPALAPGATRTVTLRVRLPDPVASDTVTNCATINWGAMPPGMAGPAYTGDASAANDGPACVPTPILAADLAPFGTTTCQRGATCNLDVRIENRGGRQFRGRAGLRGALDPAVSITSIKGLTAGLACSVTGNGRYECRADELSLKPGGGANLQLSITIPADFPHRRILHSKEMLWPDLTVKDKKPENDRHVSTIVILGPEPPPTPPVCAGGEVRGAECVCPPDALRKQTGPNAYACVLPPTAPSALQCTGGQIQDGQCICPQGTQRNQIATNAFACVAPPAPSGPQCIGGRLVDGRCICPSGTELRQTATNIFTCAQPAPAPTVTCTGGRVQDGQCVCPQGTQRNQIATNAFACVAPPPPPPSGPQCIGGQVVRGQCQCPKGTERTQTGPNIFTCVRTAPPPHCDAGWTQVERGRAKTLVAEGWEIREVTSGGQNILCARQPSLVCSAGRVQGGQCICPKGTERKQTGTVRKQTATNAFNCVKTAPPPPPLTCAGGSVQGGQCICPKGTTRQMIGKNKFRCLKLPTKK